eukprot:251555-Prymnesium_polylepis.1
MPVARSSERSRLDEPIERTLEARRLVGGTLGCRRDQPGREDSTHLVGRRAAGFAEEEEDPGASAAVLLER